MSEGGREGDRDGIMKGRREERRNEGGREGRDIFQAIWFDKKSLIRVAYSLVPRPTRPQHLSLAV